MLRVGFSAFVAFCELIMIMRHHVQVVVHVLVIVEEGGKLVHPPFVGLVDFLGLSPHIVSVVFIIELRIVP